MPEQSARHLRCPVCNFTVSVPIDAPLPEEGPTCAMGHEPTLMNEATSEVNHG